MKPSRRTPGVAVYSFVLFVFLSVVAGRAQVSVQIGQNFTGTSYGSYNTNSSALPPDCNGDVGPNDYAEFINGMFTVYSKTNGALMELKTDVDFWGAAGVGISGDYAVTDPRIIYDPDSQRWFASEVDADVLSQAFYSVFGANHFLLAVSQTSDPAGHWNAIEFDSDPDNGNFADFPTLGVDSQGVYLSGDMYDANADPTDPSVSDLGPSLVAFPKTNLLAIPIITNRTWFGIMDISARGQVLQPVICRDGSAVGSVLATGNIGTDINPHSNLVTFAVQNVTQAPSATLSAATFIPVSPYEVPYNSALAIPLLTATQPDGTATLQANDARFSAKVYAVAGVLYAVHNTELNNHIAIQWYRIRASDGTLLESGTIADPNLDLFYPSIAANSDGVVVIAFNGCGSDANAFVSCYAMAGLTVNGVTAFGSRVLLQAGVTSYHGDDEIYYGYSTSRWGDYSTVSVDPGDPTHFWSIQMYPSGTSTDSLGDVSYDWSTQITQLIVTAPPQLSLLLVGRNATISWPSSATGYQLQSAPGLVPPVVWSSVTQTPSTNGNTISVLVPISSGQQFFRLQK